MRLKTACGCLSLSTGSIIVGSLCVMSSISLMLGMWTLRGQINTSNLSHDTIILIQYIFRAVMIYLPITAISATLMIFGSLRRNSEYVFPWVALEFAGIVSAVASYVAFLVNFALLVPVEYFVGVIALLTIIAGLQTYCWLIVYSLYKDLLAEKYRHQVEPIKKILISSSDSNSTV